MDPQVTVVKLEPLDDPVLKEIVEPLDELERVDLPEKLEIEAPQVLLEPLVMELPVLKVKVDAPVVLDVKEKVVYSADLETLDYLELKEIVVLQVLLVSLELKENLVEVEAPVNPDVVVSLVLLETPVPQDNEDRKEMAVFPELLEPLVIVEVMV